ncbi:MAG: hypothetical protein ABIQ27_05650 [Flavobacterium sp.]|uniref:hypothetical protein n=1 Tax=Flavobacterium sp. TaxID=239 RepID=UPI0032635864
MIKRKPYLLLIIAAVLLLIAGFIVFGASTIVFNVHDTYYVIANSHLSWLLAMILASLSLIYWTLEKAKVGVVPVLSKIHVYGTLLFVIGFFFPYSLLFSSSESREFPFFDDIQYVNLCLTVNALLFLFLQFLFIINIFVSIIKKLRNSAT